MVSELTRNFQANTLKNSEGKPVTFEKTDDMPNVLLFSVTNFKGSAFPKITAKCTSDEDIDEDEADYRLKGVVIEERVICLLPDPHKDSIKKASF
ncbi:Hypp575 [Branchiostoma lanceolatum]|uniref:Hypp575 protein n=1 Tax=Branchiostoma lanceolatum TaxID=7740 RepID=A0A8J9W0D1_BRALA|nr:Hypp575 [Branchiostoma lanceolatum]